VASFDNQTSHEKMRQLWASITDPAAVNQSAPLKKADLSAVVEITGTSMITPFDDAFEVLPRKRRKVIHQQGAVCKFDLAVSAASNFTGVLSAGTQSGIIRLGNALPSATSFPGFGIKWPRSSVHSADLVGLRVSGPGGSGNFWNTTFSNHVTPPSELLMLNKFQQASGCVSMVGLSNACRFRQDGSEEPTPVFPFELLFEPSDAARALSSEGPKAPAELLAELTGIPAGTKLFDVYAFASPRDKRRGVRQPVGVLRTSSPCYASLFSDTELFFRHQRMEEDFAAAPEWIAQMHEHFPDAVCDATATPVSKWQCGPEQPRLQERAPAQIFVL
jgi:hypothetical protein